jgi:hypothetical protein
LSIYHLPLHIEHPTYSTMTDLTPTDPSSAVQQELELASRAIHADDGWTLDSAIAPPIHQSSTFRAGSAEEFAEMATQPHHARYYTRYGNPTLARTERVIAELEGAEAALLTASGMGAITTSVLALVSQGDHLVAQRNHYMGTTKLLTEIPAIPNEKMLVTRGQKSVIVGHRIQGANDEQSDKDGTDNRAISRVMADADGCAKRQP